MPDKLLPTLIHIADIASRALDDDEADSLIPIIDEHMLDRIGITTESFEESLMELAHVDLHGDDLFT
jgi:hypothetical protein